MLQTKKYILFVLFLEIVGVLSAQIRKTILLNSEWKFAMGYECLPELWESVDLPHTWNISDVTTNKLDYYRGQATYEKKIRILEEWNGKRLFLKFDGVNTVTDVFINDKHVGEHRGGYTAFIFEITSYLKFGKENKITVRVSNALHLDVMPLVGDFNFYGGIYRDVNLIITEKTCISPLDFASPGVYLVQKKVTKETAEVEAKILISNTNVTKSDFEIQLAVINEGKTILNQTKKVKAETGGQNELNIPFTIANPHLWNGRKDPFMYTVEVSLKHDNQIIDEVKQPLGLRFFQIDADKGFFLNGEHLQIRGVNMHQDRSEKGNAVSAENHIDDIAILTEMGANAIRLSHYPHAPLVYDLLDKNGIIAWSELPFVGQGGYRYVGFIDKTSFKDNGKQQLIEMIRQNFNHPSVCMWGLFNELTISAENPETGDNPTQYVLELKQLAKNEDPSRYSVSASMEDKELSETTDLTAWNMYYGWYQKMPADLGVWLDNEHKMNPTIKIGISEYGAGASIFQHDTALVKPVPRSNWHPEEWQAFFHEGNWNAINSRPFVWGTFIWNLFDFGSVIRNEGDHRGINDKGLVTFDRKVKKDAFWFYKANWVSDKPVLYIAGRRFVNRTTDTTSVKVYSNFKEIELFVNGKNIGKVEGETCIFIWHKVLLIKGENIIEVKATDNKKQVFSDKCVWVLE